MKKSLLSLSAALLLGGAIGTASTPARATETSVQRAGHAAIVAAYQTYDQAALKGDVATLMSFCTADFQDYSADGQVHNRAQVEAMNRMALGGMVMGVPVKITKCQTRVVSLTWRGKDAIVMVQNTSVAVARRDGRTSRSENVSLSRDYWTPTTQGWRVRQTAERINKQWIDGKRVF